MTEWQTVRVAKALQQLITESEELADGPVGYTVGTQDGLMVIREIKFDASPLAKRIKAVLDLQDDERIESYDYKPRVGLTVVFVSNALADNTEEFGLTAADAVLTDKS